MPVKLWYVPRTRATSVRWALEELSVPYELQRLDRSETRTPEHLARQPLGHVPALEDGDVRMFESAAICLWLAERHGDGKLLPPPGSAERAAVYQWMFFTATEVESQLAPLIAQHLGKTSAATSPAVVEEARAKLGLALTAVDHALAGGGFIAGSTFTVADVWIAHRLRVADMVKALPAELTAIASYRARVEARPAYARSMAD